MLQRDSLDIIYSTFTLQSILEFLNPWIHLNLWTLKVLDFYIPKFVVEITYA